MVHGEGGFFDGTRAERREVAVRLAPRGLRILAAEPDGRDVAFWEYDELRPVDEPGAGGPWRIRTRGGAGRLVVEDADLLAAIARRAPRIAARESGWRRLGLRWAGLVAGSIMVLVVVLWYGLPFFAEQATRFVPRKWEVALGDRLVEPVVRTLARMDDTDRPTFCTAPGGRGALDALTRRIAPVDSPYRFRVRVANLEMVNAFALPGGQIVLADGLLQFAESPDEIAGVLAHEMGHVLHRHSTTAIIEALGLAFLFAVLLGDLGTGIVGGAGETLIALSYRREAETEADERSLELLADAGLSTRGIADFFARIERDMGDVPAAFRILSTHPPSEHRRQRAAAATGIGASALDARAWRNLKKICARQEPLDPD